MTEARTPPPHVAEAARTVQNWLDGKAVPEPGKEPGKVEAETAPAPKPMTDAERLDYARGFDQSKMPPWKDPRPPSTTRYTR